MHMRYLIHHVDLSGVAKATYEQECPDDETAIEAAKEFLADHPSLEVWRGPRRIARLIRANTD